MSDNDWQRLSREDELQEGVLAAFKLGKSKVIAIRHNGAIHVCAGECTHYGGPLEKGLLRGHIVTCPLHSARFDLRSGEMVAAPALDHLKCYETKVEDGVVYVRPAVRAKPAVNLETTHLNYVIIGAGAAGNAAAETLREEGFSGRITLVSPENDLPYDRTILSKDFLAGKAKPEWIPLRSPKFYADQNIELIQGRKVTAIDEGTHTIMLDGGQKLPWDRLLLATGSRPRSLGIPGENMEGVFLLRSRRDSEQIAGALDGARKAAVIGTGFIGMEVAASLRKRGLDVSVISPQTIPLANIFGDDIGMWLRGVHESQGVRFYLGRKPVEFAGSGKVGGVRLDDGSVVDADVVVVGIGVIPALEYLSGTAIVDENSVPVDSHLETSMTGVFAAGDIAAFPYAPLNSRIRVEHWVVAERQGQHAARAMLGMMKPFDEVPFFWTRQYDMSLCYTGWAASFDRVAYRGTIGKEGILAGYYKKEKLRAVASLRRNLELIILGELLKSGTAVSFEQFEDENLDLRSLLHDNP